MPTLERRRITLFDLMVLTAATAIGLSFVQFGWPRKAGWAWIFAAPDFPSRAAASPRKPGSSRSLSESHRFFPASPPGAGRFSSRDSASASSLAALGLAARTGRGSRVTRGPGNRVDHAGRFRQIDGRFGWSTPEQVADFVGNGFVMLAHHPGWAVAVSWFTLALIGRCAPSEAGSTAPGVRWAAPGSSSVRSRAS